ncbi:MAG: LysR family transcriptional regulator [Clostridia bacterium]|nr:LysR family transcriptional regulator [Clostridia bacterium]
MTIQNLRYILEVARFGSISRAAQALFIAQSAVSSAIRDTEEELGVRLFNRTNRGVTLTPQGRDCVKYAQEIIERTDFLRDHFRARSAIGFSVSTQHLPFAVRAFDELLREEPVQKGEYAIREKEAFAILRDVTSGLSELGVVALEPEQLNIVLRRFEEEGVRYVEISRLTPHIFLRSSHPLAEKTCVTYEDLTPYPFVTYDQEETPGYLSEESLFYAPFEYNIHVCDRATKMSLLRSTEAFSIGVDLPNFNGDVYFRRGAAELTAIPFGDPPVPLSVGLLMPIDHRLSPMGEKYVALLKKHIEALRLPTVAIHESVDA